MLTSLRIENFAIVSHLELDFEEGMTAFTGETGAGKSIMIDALLLALGERADASVIRPGSDKCDITACFSFDDASTAASWLNEHEIDYDEGLVYLRRLIFKEGRSKSYINGQPFPLQKLKALSETLVDIHGQHQHQSLLQPTTHRKQLDLYADHEQLLAAVESAYQAHQQTKQLLDHLKNQNTTAERRELLQFQIEELQTINPQAGEMQALHEEHMLLHNAREYLEHAQQIANQLSGEDEFNVVQSLSRIHTLLASLPQEPQTIKSASELINSALIQCEEAHDEITRFAERTHLDPERLQTVEERISTLHQAARKYHVEASQLPSLLVRLESELQDLNEAEQKHQALSAKLRMQFEAYEAAAQALTQSRQKYAGQLAEEISSIIRQLGMPNGYIEIEITPLQKMHPHGLDKVEYKVCTNLGMKPDMLGKIASGGELSRISLAIQIITAQRASTPTLLFDEVDVGIGGATAALVGKLLRQLGERLQIFCVTHQPQVASTAHQHFVVEKYSEKGQTFSRILSLSSEEKIHEIARMLGGLTVTAQTRSHAQELLNTAAFSSDSSSI